ncbi:Zinc finger protein CONSTANS-LIKE 4 [Hibiscus syriacus]|uniref:Zinc finger protein CONSTANS-LIKE 4 n=1 Tax=Hibiscus syriacus TaxID=106335 RepID=A0A6A2X3Y3_HIBSY|nr:Zinc finger protein CONSTANS-LIKE 4 [Hibiscus syriacus]
MTSSIIHAANKLASRHARVWVCEVCEQEPAHVTCKADAAALCVTCDRDIHSANPLARRHERVPEEAEAASWLLPNPNHKVVDCAEVNTGQYVFPEMDPYLDMDYGHGDSKLEPQEQTSTGSDGVVPVQNKRVQTPSVNDRCFDVDFTGSKPFAYGYTQTLSATVSASSLDVGVVPDGSTTIDISNPCSKGTESTHQTVVQLSPADREARY